MGPIGACTVSSPDLATDRASTVWKMLRAAGIDPAPRCAGPTWSQFLRSRAQAILACNVFHLDTITLQRLYAFFVVEHASSPDLQDVFDAVSEIVTTHRAAAPPFEVHGRQASDESLSGAHCLDPQTLGQRPNSRPP
jgi:hypothetical protein